MSSVEGLCALCGVRGPLDEIQEHFLNIHSNAETCEETESIEREQEAKTDKEQLRWASQHIILLIRLVEKHYSEFGSTLKKKVWTKIASELYTICGEKFTHVQIENKWKGLKKTYKNIKDHNSKSGNDRRSWEYYSIMDSFMSERPEVIPPATCDSANGLKINKEKESNCPSSSVPVESPNSSFMKKRKLREQVAETRHKEKMARYDKFLALFQMSVEHQIGKKVEGLLTFQK